MTISEQKKAWGVAIGYVLFIYATLDIVRVPVNFLRAHALLKISLASLTILTFLTLLGLVLRRGGILWWRLLLLTVICSSYTWFAQWAKSPEEQIHFFQYGLVGVLFARALFMTKSNAGRIYFFSFALGTVAGIIDESIQHLLPTRHFDMKDIYLNSLSVGLGLLIYAIIKKRI